MPPESEARARAFRIACSEECEALFSGELSLQATRAWPTTAKSWLTLHEGNLGAHTEPSTNLAWWLSSQLVTNADRTIMRTLAFVPPGLPCFAGHFPGHPLLPGVIQLQWALALAEKHWPQIAVAEKFSGTARLKFKAPIKPGDLIAIQLLSSSDQGPTESIKRAENTVQFEFHSRSALLTSGRLNYRHS